jgi:hypothetical protein
MSGDSLSLGLQRVRGTDSNSLLRLYDLATEIARTSPSQQERARAERALRRITQELDRRKIRL